MYLDARKISDGDRIEAGLCVIGGGAAGITIAREFIGQGVKVILLESGDQDFDQNTQDLYRGNNTGHEYFPLDVTRLRFLGGTTNHWGGQCAPLQPHEMAARSWVPGSGWPITHEELMHYVPRAAALCELGGLPFDMATVEKALGKARVPIKKRYIRHLVSYISAPTRFGERYGAELGKASNVSVLLNANLTELKTNADASAVTGAEVKCLTGTGFNVAAKHYVLACGGIENARILLLSNSVAKRGLGNDNDLVGRYFADHPGIDMAFWFPSRRDIDLSIFPVSPLNRGTPPAHSMIWLDLSPEVLEKHRLTSFKVFPRPTNGWYGWQVPGVKSYAYVSEQLMDGKMPEDLGNHLLTMIEDIDVLAEKTYDKVRDMISPNEEPPSATLATSIEPMPNHESRVILGEDRDALGQRRVELRLRYTEADVHTIIRGTELLATRFAAEGLGRMRLNFDAEGVWKRLRGRNHHMCTTRMHSDPKRGVVDSDCRVHGVENLFVAGSSVFTTAGAGVPTMNLVALALRLAEYIRGKS